MNRIAPTFFRHFLIVFILPILQVISQTNVENYNQDGLITTIFNTPLGKVSVYLPKHSTNEQISGTVNVQPIGASDNKRAKNKIELEGYKLMYANTSMPLKEKHFSCESLVQAGNTSLNLIDDKGKVIASSTISVSFDSKLEIPIATYIPEYLVNGESAKIQSIFDGKITNSKVALNNQNLEILAESKSEMYFRVPSNITGTSLLQFTEGEKSVESKVNVLNLDLSVGRTNLQRGEQTTLSIKISGLHGLENEVPITITNKSPSNIALEGGNSQEIVISPSTDASSGNYSNQINVDAIQTGDFTISVSVKPPKPSNEASQEVLLCHCRLMEFTYLLTPEACVSLGGSCEDAVEDNLTEDEENVTPPNFRIEMPHIIADEHQAITFQIRDYNQQDCIAVIFSYKPSDDKSWTTIGSDTNNADGLSIHWNLPTDLNGIVEIRAEVVNKNNVVAKRTSSIYFNIPQNLPDIEGLIVTFTIMDSDIKRAEDKARKTDKDINGLGDEIFKKWQNRYDAEDRKKKNEDAQNELIAIDKVLDSVPKTYKDALKKILDSLANLKKQLPDIIDNDALQKAVDDAQSRVNDCLDRLEKLKKEQQELEEERDRLKAETDAALEEMDALMRENGMTGGYGYHPDGRYWYGYVGDESSNGDVLYSEKYNQLKSKLRGLKKEYLKTLKRLNNLPSEIAEAEKDCDELNEALAKAKEAKENADLHAAAELEAEDICREINRLLRPLWQWCIKNLDHCNFREAIEALIDKCPKDSNEFDDFWKDFDDLISRKKEQEDNFGKAAEDAQKKIDDIDDEISGLEDEIRALEEKRRKELEAADALRKQQAAEAAKAKAEAAARAKERKKQKEDDDKIKDLIKEAKSDDAGDDAFQNLLKGMGLDLLDEATGNLKLGKIIGGLLVIKDMPDCVCPLITALRDAIAAKNRGFGEGPAIHVEKYLKAWKDCANLPSLSSVSVGGTELTRAINNMTKAQTKRALEALNQAIRIQCN